jgi:RNA polymerase sigma-70 factor (ECF subfamily)
MSEPTDQHLLDEWAARHSEAAFRSLLGRHGGFVYGAALRRAGDAGLAEEITQDVFARLAQNARRLVSHPTLAGWLHRTTMLIALDRIRRMTRSARRLAGLSTMNQNARDPWEEILPHLDKALDCLGPREREVVMLHFIERRSFPEIARAIGCTPDAARMRANRALASLARLLGKKGSTVAVATLATGLGTAATHAMPASIAALTPQALAGMGKVSVLSFVIHAIQTMKTAKVAAAIALSLALATPLVIQQGEIAAAEARIAKLQQQAGGPQGKTAAQPSAPVLAAGVGAGLDLRQLGDDALEEGAHAKRRIRIAVARLDANNLTGLIETVLHGGMMIAKREALLEALLRELRSRDPAQFLAWTMKVYATLFPDGVVGLQSSNFAFGFRSTACDAFREWVAVKPAEAEAWAAGNREAE